MSRKDDRIDTVDDYMHDGLVEDHDGAPYPEHVQRLVGLFRCEVDRLRAALEEEFDFDRLPIPRFVNYLIDIWHEGDGYDPGDEYEVMDAVHRSIRRATKAEAAGAEVQEAEK